jgi:hypothetical protein
MKRSALRLLKVNAVLIYPQFESKQRTRHGYKINTLIRIYFYAELRFLWSRGIVVGTETRLRAGRSAVRIPVDTRYFSFLHKAQTGSEVH